MNIKYKILSIIPDKCYLKIKYYFFFKKKLNLKNPESFNEKMQYLKLHDRKQRYCNMVDKYEVKKYVAKKIGKKYIIPNIGVYDSFNDIDFDELPDSFVIKCTHDSGSVIIVRDKKRIDAKQIRKRIHKRMKMNYYQMHREWPYKNVRPRIIIEKYMEDKNNKTMRDYKFFCFNGKPELMYLSEGLENHATARMSFYDMDFKLTDCKRKDYKLLDYAPKKPKNWDKMKQFSSILSTGIPHVRVDWYEINGELYFGELTFSTCAGMIPFESEKWDKYLGNLINLNNTK